MSFNALQHETSPYLLQHAENPVQWLPWGKEAFDRARAESKPVFLSAGYSSCHWCHVMAHESFEDEGIAEILNTHFIPVKLDREERPDVDALYMLATQVLTGRGGWPNSVFLLPDQRPFYAGTYWPREDRAGYAGFRSILRQLASVWKNRTQEIEAQAQSITERLQALSIPEPAPEAGRVVEPLPQLMEELRESFDAEHGGFGGAPKFPPHGILLTLLDQPMGSESDMWLRATLDGMALGGIRDQAGGAFHRYATDAEWFLPHFEIMLYDNAQLAEVYSRAAVRFDSESYREVAEGICEAVLRDFSLEGGVFATAWDADSEGGEGEFYLWTIAELNEVLGDRSPAFRAAYRIVEGGNAHDEATGRPLGKSILHPVRYPDVERKRDLTTLRAHREKTRTPPFLDDKVLTAWNGLMIRGLAIAGKQLEMPRYVEAAEEAAETLWAWNEKGMHRSFRNGEAGPAAVLEDYSFFAHGLLALGRTEQARTLMNELEARFQSEEGGYTMVPGDEDRLLINQQDPYDNATPSGIGIAVQVWQQLGETDIADRIRKAYQGAVSRSVSATQMLWRT